MIKNCVVLNGQVIHIGDWDYFAPMDDTETNGEITNPMPVGAVVEQRDFEYNEDRGWYESGTQPAPTLQERLEATEQALFAVMEVLG